MADSQLIINQPLATILDIIGDRWNLLILRDAFVGRTRYEQFRQHTGASRSILSQRLDRLVMADLLYKRPYGSSENRFEYRLTSKGMTLFGCALLAWQWERDWAGHQDLPGNLHHTLCNHGLVSKAHCRACHQELKLGDVRWPNPQAHMQFSQIRSLSGQRQGRNSSMAKDLALATVSNLVGDRWNLLILIAAFFGVKQHDEFHKQLGIATNILSQRLTQLVDNDILQREPYQDNPPRHHYALTEKGQSLYALVMTLRQWANAKLPATEQAASLVHFPCGHDLVIDVVCDHCGQKPWPTDVVTVDTTAKR